MQQDDMMEDEVWDQEAEEMDREFAEGGCVQVEFDDNEPPPDYDPDGMGVGNDDDDGEAMAEEPEVDDSMAHVSHAETVLSAAFNPADRRVLLTGSQDDAAVLWSVEEKPGGGLQCVQRCRLTGHSDTVSQVAFSHDGRYAATGSYDGTVRIWNPENGELVHVLDGPSKEIEWIIWHPKGHAILAGSVDTMAWMWWAPTGKLMQMFAGHGQSVTCGCWGLGGKLIITGSQDCSVIVWNPRTGMVQQRAHEVHGSAVISMCAHPEAPVVVSGSEDSSVKVLQMETGKVLKELQGHTDSVEFMGFSHQDPNAGMQLFATASMDGRLMIWDSKTFDLRCTIKEHVEKGGITRFKWLPPPVYGSWIATCGTDNTVRLFNCLTGTCLRTLTGHTDTVVDLDVAIGQAPGTTNPAAQQLAIASASEDKTCRIFLVDLWTLGDSTAAGAVRQAVAAVAGSPAPGPGGSPMPGIPAGSPTNNMEMGLGPRQAPTLPSMQQS